MYSNVASIAMGAPRSLHGYWCYFQNPNYEVSATNANPFVYGQMNLNDYIDRFLVNTAIGKTIATYKYDIHHGHLVFPKHHITNNDMRSTDLNVMKGYSLIKNSTPENRSKLVQINFIGCNGSDCKRKHYFQCRL